jgi:hypothetical protein
LKYFSKVPKKVILDVFYFINFLLLVSICILLFLKNHSPYIGLSVSSETRVSDLIIGIGVSFSISLMYGSINYILSKLLLKYNILEKSDFIIDTRILIIVSTFVIVLTTVLAILNKGLIIF